MFLSQFGEHHGAPGCVPGSWAACGGGRKNKITRDCPRKAAAEYRRQWEPSRTVCA